MTNRESQKKRASGEQGNALAFGTSHKPGCSALNKRWIVAEEGEPFFMKSASKNGERRYESNCEDLSILTEDRYEVVGCSEWMRADREVFDYIVALHNANLAKP